MTDQLSIILGPWLATYLLHSTLLLGSAWLVVTCCRRLPEEMKEALWKTALVGGLVTATLQVGLGISPLAGSMNLARQRQTALNDSSDHWQSTLGHSRAGVEFGTPLNSVTDQWPEAHLHAADPVGPLLDEAPSPNDLIATAPLPHPAPVEVAAGSRADAETAASPLVAAASSVANYLQGLVTEWRGMLAWRAILPAAALAIGLLSLALSLLGRGRLRARLAGRVNIHDGPLLDLLQSLTRRAGLRRRVRLTCSDLISSPIAFGMVRGEICLPTRVIEELDPRQQETLLAHELAHLVRRDPLWLALCQVMETLLLVQPLNRLARRRLQELAELACDDWAVRQTGLRSPLARCLTEVAMWMAHAPRRPAGEYVIAMAGSPSALRRRVVRLLDTERKPSGGLIRRWAVVVGVAALGLASLTLPAVTHASVEATGPAQRQHVESPPDAEAPRLDPDSIIDSLAALDGEILALTEDIARLRRSMQDLPPDDELAELIRRFDRQLENLGGRRDLLRSLSAPVRNEEIDDALAAEIGPPGRIVGPVIENPDS